MGSGPACPPLNGLSLPKTKAKGHAKQQISISALEVMTKPSTWCELGFHFFFFFFLLQALICYRSAFRNDNRAIKVMSFSLHFILRPIIVYCFCWCFMMVTEYNYINYKLCELRNFLINWLVFRSICLLLSQHIHYSYFIFFFSVWTVLVKGSAQEFLGHILLFGCFFIQLYSSFEFLNISDNWLKFGLSKNQSEWLFITWITSGTFWRTARIATESNLGIHWMCIQK